MNYKYSIVGLFFITFLSLQPMDNCNPQSFGECVKLIAENIFNNPVEPCAIKAILCISNENNQCFIEKHQNAPEYKAFQQLDLSNFIEKFEAICPPSTHDHFESVQSRLAPHNKYVIFTQKQIATRPQLQAQLQTQNTMGDSLKRQPSLDMRKRRSQFLGDDPEKALLEQQKIAQGILLDNTKNYRRDQQQKKDLMEKLNEQFEKHIETIIQWNEQKEHDNPGFAGSAVSRIAENIEHFAKMPSYKNFQNLDLSKLLTACGKFNHYTKTPTNGISKLQEIQNSLMPHNTSVNFPDKKQPVIVELPSDNTMIATQSSFAEATADKGDQLLHETPEDTLLKKHQPEPDQAKQEPTQQATDHKEQTDPEQIDLPEEAQAGNLIPQESPALLPQEQPELTEEHKALKTNNQQEDNAPSNILEVPNQPDLSVPSEQPASLTPENQNIVISNQKTAEKTQPEQETQPLDTPIPHEQPDTPRKDNLETTTASETSSMQSSTNDNQQEPQKMTASAPSYKKHFFWGISLCTILALIYCHKHYKDVIVDCFNNPQDVLTYLRRILSPMAT